MYTTAPSWPVQGEFGPFNPNQECQVPIWMAHTLWKRKKCTIKAPEWLNAAHLEGKPTAGC